MPSDKAYSICHRYVVFKIADVFSYLIGKDRQNGSLSIGWLIADAFFGGSWLLFENTPFDFEMDYTTLQVTLHSHLRTPCHSTCHHCTCQVVDHELTMAKASGQESPDIYFLISGIYYWFTPKSPQFIHPHYSAWFIHPSYLAHVTKCLLHPSLQRRRQLDDSER